MSHDDPGALCEHGAPATRLTSGRPSCPMCRRQEDARTEARRQAEEARRRRIADLARIPRRTVDTAALAAHDD